jgi:hypothetical protein
MKDKLNVEVEGEELLLQSDNGSYAIIPKKDKARVMYYLKNDKQDRLNKLISKLPRHTDYAEDGNLITPDPPVDKAANAPQEETFMGGIAAANFYDKNKDKLPNDVKEIFGLFNNQKQDLFKYLKNDFSYLSK